MSVYSDDDYDRACRKIAALASDHDDPKLTLKTARLILRQIQDIAEGGDIPLEDNEDDEDETAD